jgi:hypothetical protein
LSIKSALKFIPCLALAIAFAPFSAAQQTTPASPDSSAQTQQPGSTQTAPQQNPPQPARVQQPGDQQPSSNKEKEKNQAPDLGGAGKVEGTSNDRLFYTLPNFLSVQNQKLPPLSVKDKFKVVALGNFDYIQYPWWAIVAAVAQAENSEPQFRQGWEAYAKRYGTTAGDSSVENFMTGAVFPSILRQDPRFYYSENGKIPHRILYAVSRIFVTRADSGRTQFNYSELLGAATAAAISDYTYHPKSTVVNGEFVPSDRTLSNTAIVFGTQVGLDSITFVVKEFWPDIHRKMSHKKSETAATSQKTP